MERKSETNITYFNQKAYEALLAKVAAAAKTGDIDAADDVDIFDKVKNGAVETGRKKA